ncbi:unnamed protein product, partial [Prorocentrum cordatum]
QALAAFKSGRSPVLAATDVAARGLDIKGVKMVVNFDVANNAEDHVHRIGRTGRAGVPGVAVTFLDRSEGKQAYEVMQSMRKVGQEIPDDLRQLADRVSVTCPAPAAEALACPEAPPPPPCPPAPACPPGDAARAGAPEAESRHVCWPEASVALSFVCGLGGLAVLVGFVLGTCCASRLVIFGAPEWHWAVLLAGLVSSAFRAPVLTLYGDMCIEGCGDAEAVRWLGPSNEVPKRVPRQLIYHLGQSVGHPGGSVRRGDDVAFHGSELLTGRKGVNVLMKKPELIEDIGAGNVEAYRSEEAHHDTRMLKMQRDSRGACRRPRRDVACDVNVAEQQDRPVPGSPTADWCPQAPAHRSEGPVGGDRRGEADSRLSLDQWGVTGHETVTKILERRGTHDQCDAVNRAGGEDILSRTRLNECFYYEVGREAETGKWQDERGGRAARVEEMAIFRRKHREYGEAKTASELLSRVVAELGRDSGIVEQMSLDGGEGGQPKSRRGQRRRGERAHCEDWARCCATTLNELDRGSADPQPLGLRASAGQERSLSMIQAAVAELGRPPTDLTRQGSLAELLAKRSYTGEKVDPGPPACLAQVDIQDAFLPSPPPELVSLFCLRPVTAGLAGVGELDGAPVSPSQLVYPHLRVVPMGWNHALRWCQRTHEYHAFRQPGVTPANKLSDKKPGVRLDRSGFAHTEYVDNFAAIGRQAAEVDAVADSVHEALSAAGLRLRLGIEGLLERGFATGRDLEVRCTDASPWGRGVCLAERDLLSIAEAGWWSDRWRFSRGAEDRVRPRDASLREELNMAAAAGLDDLGRVGTAPHLDGLGEADRSGVVPEIGPKILQRPWTTVSAGRWRRREAMPVLEGRALVWGVRHVNRGLSEFGKRVLFLTDGLSEVLALEKGALSLPAPRDAPLPSGSPFRPGGPAQRWAGPAAPPTLARAAPQPPAGPGDDDGPTGQVAAGGAGCPKDRHVADSEGLSVAERENAEDLYQRVYHAPLAEFRSFAATQGLRLGTAADYDGAALERAHQALFDSGGVQEGSRLKAVLHHYHPRLLVAKGLPGFARALRGWRRLVPPRSRLPLLWEVARAEASRLAANPCAARLVAVMFVFCLQLVELTSPAGRQVVPPSRAAGHDAWPLVLFPMEKKTPSISGTCNASIVGDLPFYRFIGNMLKLPKANVCGGELVARAQYMLLVQACQAAGQQLRFGGPPGLYQLRDGGAPADLARGRQSSAEVPARGRCATDSSVTECGRGGRIADQLAKLPMPSFEHAVGCAQKIGGALCKRCRPLPPARAAPWRSKCSAARATSVGPGGGGSKP